MQIEIVPTAQFVSRKIHESPIKMMVEPFSVDTEVLEGILVNHFHDMGIFFVKPAHEQMLTEQIIKQIRLSPEIHRVVQQAAHQRARAKVKRS